ncbi:MAG: hypothetical protein CMN30_07470 [Sandaracinus sp.]|nr:hypothetical protein [Sandaracinus sp.]
MDLRSGASEPVAEVSSMPRDVVALSDGERWLVGGEWSGGSLRAHVQNARGGQRPAQPVGGPPYAASPDGAVVWGGYRCVVSWNLLFGDEVVPWTHQGIRWPDTHAKKLMGHKDNRNLWVHLAPDASACLSVLEHDVMLTPGPPLRWREAAGIAVAEPLVDHPLRALFFQSRPLYDELPSDEELRRGDEEARGRRATVALGPSSELRYAVGFDFDTWRFLGDQGERIGRTGDGWALYDEQHRVVARGAERLWAGWHRWLVLEAKGQLLRWDLETDQRVRLPDPGRALREVFPVPGTPNALLVADGEPLTVRLV